VHWAHGVASLYSTVGPTLGGYMLDNKWSLDAIFLTFAVPLVLASGFVIMLGMVVRPRMKTVGWVSAESA
jgi:hypothetical protein